MPDTALFYPGQQASKTSTAQEIPPSTLRPPHLLPGSRPHNKAQKMQSKGKSIRDEVGSGQASSRS